MSNELMSERNLKRFWAKVALPDENGCMLWLAALDITGYGVFRVGPVNRKAHRLSLLHAEGLPPHHPAEAAHAPVICHRPHCVAPAHLRWTTTADNAADRRLDGTQTSNPGEKNPQAKLTAEQVLEIRTRYAAGGITCARLAGRYGVSGSLISLIVREKIWAHLNGEAS
jgi:hypothetical protein